MPTYEYECEKCKYRFDRYQHINEEPLSDCPECGGHVKRLISGGGGIIFHGTGFYCTDYRSKEYKARAKEDSGSSTPAKTSNSD